MTPLPSEQANACSGAVAGGPRGEAPHEQQSVDEGSLEALEHLLAGASPAKAQPDAEPIAAPGGPEQAAPSQDIAADRADAAHARHAALSSPTAPAWSAGPASEVGAVANSKIGPLSQEARWTQPAEAQTVRTPACDTEELATNRDDWTERWPQRPSSLQAPAVYDVLLQRARCNGERWMPDASITNTTRGSLDGPLPNRDVCQDSWLIFPDF